MTEILVLYYSAHGSVRSMAQLVARGINQVAGASARLRMRSGRGELAFSGHPVLRG